MTEHGKRFSGILPIFLIIMSVLMFFSKVICSGRPLFGSDFVLYFYPLKKLIRDYVFSHGTLPLWNPFQYDTSVFLYYLTLVSIYSILPQC